MASIPSMAAWPPFIDRLCCQQEMLMFFFTTENAFYALLGAFSLWSCLSSPSLSSLPPSFFLFKFGLNIRGGAHLRTRGFARPFHYAFAQQQEASPSPFIGGIPKNLHQIQRHFFRGLPCMKSEQKGRVKKYSKFTGQTVDFADEEVSKNRNILWTSYMEAPLQQLKWTKFLQTA